MMCPQSILTRQYRQSFSVLQMKVRLSRLLFDLNCELLWIWTWSPHYCETTSLSEMVGAPWWRSHQWVQFLRTGHSSPEPAYLHQGLRCTATQFHYPESFTASCSSSTSVHTNSRSLSHRQTETITVIVSQTWHGMLPRQSPHKNPNVKAKQKMMKK